jgi:phospholipid transport system substrate-binding protein
MKHSSGLFSPAIFKKALCAIALILMAPMFISSAYAYNSYYAQPYQTQENPVTTIQNALDKLKTFNANSNNINPLLLRSFIENEIIPHFAFDQMTRWIAGPYARQMNPADLMELEERVKQTFLASLGKHLGSYDASNTRVTFRPARYRGRNEATVTALIYRHGTRPDRLEFRMRTHGNSWKIIDVKANGTSAVLYYRKHFTDSLRQYRY